jgi:hypothetical protein
MALINWRETTAMTSTRGGARLPGIALRWTGTEAGRAMLDGQNKRAS